MTWTRSWRTLLLLCVLPWVLTAHAATTPFKINGVQGTLLQNVEHRLTELNQSKRLQHLTAEALQEQVEKALSPYGFFKPVIHITAPTSPKNPWRIWIQPGPPLLIQSLTVSITGAGEHNALIQQTRNNLPIHAGDVLNTVRYEDAKTALFSSAESEGYLQARFERAEVRIDLARYSADLVLAFDTGPRSYFGPVTFKPAGMLAPDFLHRYVPFKVGDPYSSKQVLDLNTNLASSGYFRAVEVKPNEQASPSSVPVIVHMDPISRTTYSLGAGYGTDTGPRGRAGLHIMPVNAYGHQFNAVAQGSIAENALQMQYVIPGADPVHDHYNINGGFSNLNYTSGDSNAILFSFVQQHLQHDYQRNLSINALHERFRYSSQSRSEQHMLYPKINLSVRHVTDELFSPSGYNISLNALAGTRAILSSINAAEASLDVKVAYTYDPWRTRVYLHAIQGGVATNNIYAFPLSLALLLGGAENMKAYSFNSIGPGKILTYGGLELQKETWDTWYLLAFVDAGDVYQPRPRAFQHDMGLGLMWRSPVGPIKIALAQPCSGFLQPQRDHSPRLVINMGPDL